MPGTQTYGQRTNALAVKENETIVLDLTVVDPDRWVHDLDRFRCVLCVRKFGTFMRKHHCRTCGEIICSRCSRFRYVRVPNIGISSVRACLDCIMRAKSVDPKHASIHEEQARRLSTLSTHPAEDDVESVEYSNNQVKQKSAYQSNQTSPTGSRPYSHRTSNSQVRQVSNRPEENNQIEDAQYWPKAPVIPNEENRLKALYSYKILDTGPDTEYDAICELAARSFSCTVAAISFMDSNRQWFKASVGIAQTELPREVALCAHAMVVPSPLIVLDTTLDPRFSKNPLVSGGANIRFYASASILSSDGHVLGTVLVLDTKPRDSITAQLEEVLTHLASLTGKMLEDHRAETGYRESHRIVENDIPKPKENQISKQEENHSFSRPKAEDCDEDSNVPTSRKILARKSNGFVDIEASSKALTVRGDLLEAEVSNTAIVEANAQQNTTRELVASNRKMEGMYMDLLCRVTDTQQLLATQQGAMLMTLSNHGNRITDIEETLKRIEGAILKDRE